VVHEAQQTRVIRPRRHAGGEYRHQGTGSSPIELGGSGTSGHDGRLTPPTAPARPLPPSGSDSNLRAGGWAGTTHAHSPPLRAITSPAGAAVLGQDADAVARWTAQCSVGVETGCVLHTTR